MSEVHKKNQTVYLCLSMIAGFCWGTAGIFVRSLSEVGMNNITINFCKFLFAAIIVFIAILIKDPKALRINMKDLPLLAGVGVVGNLLLSVAYNEAILRTSLSLAAVLLSLAPIFVLFFGMILFGEKMTRGKLLCVCFAIFGSILLSGLFDKGSSMPWDIIGFLFGLTSAFANGAYTILSKMATNKGYGSMTIYFYAFVVITILVLPFADVGAVFDYLMTSPGQATFNYLGISVYASLLPGILYTIAVMNVEAGKVAAINAGAQPLASMIAGVLLYHEIPSLLGIFGMLVTVGALIRLIRLDETDNE